MADMLEYLNEVTEEKIASQADSLIKRLNTALEDGLEAKQLKDLDQYAKITSTDLALVELGLKPAAVHLEEAFSFIGREFLPYLHGDKTSYNFNNSSLHNIELVERIIARNELAARKALADIGCDFSRLSFDLSPGTEDFGLLLEFLCQPNVVTTDANYFAGLILGFPSEASRVFSDNQYRIFEEEVKVWNKAVKDDFVENVDLAAASLEELTENSFGEREEFLRLAKLTGVGDPIILGLVKKIRFANVPGTPYITFGNMTRKDELRLSYLYKASGFEKKLENLLAAY